MSWILLSDESKKFVRYLQYFAAWYSVWSGSGRHKVHPWWKRTVEYLSSVAVARRLARISRVGDVLRPTADTLPVSST